MTEVDAMTLMAAVGQADTLPAAIDGVVGARTADPLATTGLLSTQNDGSVSSATGEPTQLGRFSVLRRIGAGGMGVVYMAYDAVLDRRIALKLLHPDRDTPEDSLRMIREAQAMARLTHPNVVSVHDVGTFSGGIFLAMDFVEGQTLREWQQEPAQWRKTIEIYLQAGSGLSAAHEAGLVHRDFKPENVVVGADGRVRVLDFGLARASTFKAGIDFDAVTRALAGDLRRSSALERHLTAVGAIPGTPAYMSPEQFLGRDADALSDQFSFCVSLYEQLYGRRPFAGSSVRELSDNVLRGKIPEPPADARAARWVFRLLCRGLSPAPASRWPSMHALIDEFERGLARRRYWWLTTLPVTAAFSVGLYNIVANDEPTGPAMCPDSQTELLGIWDPARAVAVKDAIMATGSSYAGEAWATIEPQMQRYADSWAEMRDEACQTHGEGRQSDHLFDLRTACLDQRRAAFGGLVEALASIDATTLEQAISAAGRLPGLESCADSRALTAAIAPPEDPQTRVQVQGWRETLARAEAQENAGRYQAGLDLVEKARTAALRLDYPPLLAEALLRQGSLQMETNALKAADAALDQALLTAMAADHKPVAAQAISKQAFLRAARLDQPAQAQAIVPMARALNVHIEGDVDLHAEFLNNLGVVHICTGAYKEAEQELRAALALRERHGPARSVKTLIILDNLGSLAMYENRDLDRVAIYRQVVATSGPALGEHHPEHQRFVRNLANGLQETGRPGEAGELLRHLERDLEATPAGLAHAGMYAELGAIELVERDLDAARRHFERVLRDASDQAYLVQNAQMGLGRVAALAGDEAGVRLHFGAVLAESERRLGAQHVSHLARQYNFAAALLDLGRPREAIEQLELVLARIAGLPATESLGVLPPDTRYSLGKAHQKLGDLAAAERELTLAKESYEQVLPFPNLNIVPVKQALGEVALGEGRIEVALDWLRQAESNYMAIVEPQYVPLALTRLALARALSGDSTPPPAEAAALAGQALTALRAAGPAFAPEALAVQDFLRAHR